MGNYRFRISNMIPNSWFYKLKDVSTSNKMTKKQPITSSSSLSLSSSSSSLSSFPSAAPLPQPTKPHNDDQPAAEQRKSYYFTRDLTVPDLPTPKTRSPDPPRKSYKKRRPPTHKKPIHRKLVPGELNSAGRYLGQVTPESVLTESYPGSNSSDTEFLSPELPCSGGESLNCSCRTNSSYDDVYGKVDLPPIITKPAKQEEFGSGKWVIDEGSRTLSVKLVKEDIMGISTKEEGGTTHTRSPVRRFTGGKVKGNTYSPRIGNRVRVQGINGCRRSMGNRRSLSESMAVVKTSVDPQRDFKESMVEMIMENNMKSSKDLEELLACYLSLNSNEYHDLIIKVFKQIWFESSNIRL